jgi:hypothetical protein
LAHSALQRLLGEAGQSGDVILDVAGKVVSDPSDITKELADLQRRASAPTARHRAAIRCGLFRLAATFGVA